MTIQTKKANNSEKQRGTTAKRHRDNPATDKELDHKYKTTADARTELQRPERQIRGVRTPSPQPLEPASK